MEFGLSEDQRILEETVKRFFDERSALDAVRKMAESENGFDAELWQSIVELGVLGAIVPEQYGGAGLGFFDAFIVLEAAGRTTAPAPLLGSMVMAPLALLEAGTDEQRENYLPQLASGTSRAAIATADALGSREDAGLTLTGSSLNGKALFVIDAGAADLLVATIGKDTLAIVKTDSAGLTITPMPTIDRTRCLAEVIFQDAQVEVLGEAGAAGPAITRMLDAGRVALAADTLGAAEVMIEKAVAYAGERQQFNRPIGSFQAVKHMCADMVAELEPARSLIWYAAHAFDHVPDEARLMACHAKAHMAEVGTKIAKTAVEVHGGMGFTDLMGLHYWFKRIGLNRQLLGMPEQVRHEAAVIQQWVTA